MNFWRSLVGKLWMTITVLVATVLLTLGLLVLPYIDTNFTDSEAITRFFFFVSVAGFALTTFFALFLFTKITQPMRLLIQAADSIRKGNYDTRLSLRTSDEIGVLANSFNHMAEELEDTIRSLNHEKDHLASVLRSMNDAVITLDRSGTVILTNPPGDRILHSWKKDRDLTDREKSGDHVPIPEPLVPMFTKVLEQEGDQSMNVHVRQGVWSVHMAPLSSEGDVRGAVAVLRDVTEEVKLEKMRRDFVANVSHEIRTPLSMMQGYSEAILDGMASSPEEARELVQVIYDESLRMGRLVHDLLDLARMEDGHTKMEMRLTNVKELMERVYRKFNVRAKERNIELRLEIAEGSLVLEQANEDRLEQVLTNLLDNAFRHTHEGGGIRIEGSLVDSSQGKKARIAVRDLGVGIPPEDLPYIFDRFYKADKARVRGEAVGTGLGLYIVKNIVEAHHGTIRAESKLGVGTVFIIELPVESQEA
ncbi:sensor histidine kinase [Paenibacillus sp. CAA11]|uniref:HAMP domain-containing sensor histidine kinase n=1 Tax=Paenibacillus sp. CAA11 TaxID=1532905 RepID=UPI000D353D1F|nr:ATP-binding protein [Paenibacillus sp. CAA11]AWB45042.1 sensor histidine kinase [Paenibacillus sp. CAA11]